MVGDCPFAVNYLPFWHMGCRISGKCIVWGSESQYMGQKQ